MIDNLVLYLSITYCVLSVTIIFFCYKGISKLKERLQEDEQRLEVYDMIKQKHNDLKQYGNESERLRNELVSLNKSVGMDFDDFKKRYDE